MGAIKGLFYSDVPQDSTPLYESETVAEMHEHATQVRAALGAESRADFDSGYRIAHRPEGNRLTEAENAQLLMYWDCVDAFNGYVKPTATVTSALEKLAMEAEDATATAGIGDDGPAVSWRDDYNFNHEVLF